MNLVPPKRLEDLSALIEEAQSLPPRERARRIAQRTSDPVLLTEITRLLAAHERADGTVARIEPGEVEELLRAASPLEHAIGRYELVRLIGRGTHGVTYLARDPDGGAVAVKLLFGMLAAEEEARRQLVRETRAIATLGHPCVARVIEIDETPDARPYLAMAYHEGDTLSRRVRRGALPVAEAVAIARQIAEALEALHSIGIVHGDVKPSNVLVQEGGGATLADASIARIAGGGSVAGTGPDRFAYASPEQLRGRCTARCDVWAIGVTLYEMLAGFRPFEGMTADALSRAIHARDMPLLEERRPDVPPALIGLVDRCLQVDPSRRPADGGVLSFDLRAIERALEEPPPARRQYVVSRARATAAVAAAGALGMALWISCAPR